MRKVKRRASCKRRRIARMKPERKLDDEDIGEEDDVDVDIGGGEKEGQGQ